MAKKKTTKSASKTSSRKPKTSGIAPKAPQSVWTKPLTADLKKLGTALGKGAVNLGTTRWEAAANNGVEAFTALGINPTTDDLAGRLLSRSIATAWVSILKEADDLLPQGEASKAPKIGPIIKQLEANLETADNTLTEDLFNRPSDLPIAKAAQQAVASILTGMGLTDHAAQQLTTSFPYEFAHALHQEYAAQQGKYQPLMAALKSEFTDATRRERQWLHYANALERQVNRRVLGEPFGLRSIFVEPNAWFIKNKTKNKLRDAAMEPALGRAVPDAEAELDSVSNTDDIRQVVSLREQLNAWIKKGDRKAPIRVVTGQPGSGKSAFAKVFAADLAREGLNVLYLPLHLINLGGSLKDAVHNFCAEAQDRPDTPLDPDTGPAQLLLILDGLDELSKLNDALDVIARDFLDEVQRTADSLNETAPRLRVIIFGRPVAVSPIQTRLREQGSILHLLPFFVNEDARKHYTDPKKRLVEDKRDAWWNRYQTAHNHPTTGLPDALKREDLQEITSEPLLGHLVAMSHEHGEVDFTKEVNLNTVYHDLLRRIYDRSYADGQHRVLKDLDLTYDQFLMLLEHIAESAWHGEDARTTTAKRAADYCERAGLAPLFHRFQDAAKQDVTRLFVAFYFQEKAVAATTDKLYEFTHKTFGEFLTAQRIVRLLIRISEEFVRRKQTPGSGWSVEDALVQWVNLCGPRSIDRDLQQFIAYEIARSSFKTSSAWQEALIQMINHVLRHGNPLEKIQSCRTFQEARNWSNHAEEALFIVLSSASSRTKAMSKIDWKDSNSFASTVKRLQGDVVFGRRSLIMNSLDRLYINGQYALFLDLFGGQFQESDLSRSQFIISSAFQCDFTQATLKKIDFNGGNHQGAVFINSKLTDAILISADLSGCDFSYADATGADFRDADLTGANFSNATLKDANFKGVIDEGTIWPKGFKPKKS
ncbi:MAG: pentapeptide repeat-containing protein [Planctomycetota bacterium]